MTTKPDNDELRRTNRPMKAGVGQSTVERIRKRCVEEGVDLKDVQRGRSTNAQILMGGDPNCIEGRTFSLRFRLAL